MPNKTAVKRDRDSGLRPVLAILSDVNFRFSSHQHGPEARVTVRLSTDSVQKFILLPFLLLMTLTPSAFAEKIVDITRLGGTRTNVITGMGLVVGLNHTGDGGAYLPTMRSMAAMMNRYGGPSTLVDVTDVSNVAIVSVYATLPASGVRNGDQLDVAVVSVGAATSLKGGVLYMVAMNGPTGKPYTTYDKQGKQISSPFALANGILETDNNPSPLRGVVRGGAVMEIDVVPRYIDETGRFQLIIDSPIASLAMASEIAKVINESSDSDEIAVALNSKTVVVQIPAEERVRPDNFMARILKLKLPDDKSAEVSQMKETVDSGIPGLPLQRQVLAAQAASPVGDISNYTSANASGIRGQWLGGVLLLVIGAFFGRSFAGVGSVFQLKRVRFNRGNMPINRLLPIVLVLLLTQSAFAEKIADITRMDGARTNVITGMGLVMGLKGTGDGGAYLPAMKQLQAMMAKFENMPALSDLSSAGNVAIVSVYATLPATGVHNGDTVDVQVVSMGAASSLKGGVLYMVAMNGPSGKPFTTFDKQGHAVKLPFALAKGALEPDDNPTPLRGVIRAGAVMEVDLPARYFDDTGRFKLNIDQPSASWAMSSTIAKVINESGDTAEGIAVSLDPNTVLVQIPKSERDRPDGFIARILALPIPTSAPAEARVLIDDRSVTMVITGDVEISPVVISHKGLTITAITPAPVPSIRNPQVLKKDSIPFDTTNQGGARLKDLADAFDLLKVPTEDRIAIVKDLYDIGKLHAKMTIDGQER